MASPPPKRLRRSKAIISDEEEGQLETSPPRASTRRDTGSTAANVVGVTTPQKSTKSTQTKSKSKPTTAAAKATSRKPAPSAEPVSSKIPKKSPRKKKIEENSRSLHTFFGRASEEERWTRKAETPIEDIEGVEDGDAIEDDDDSLDEAFSRLAEGQDGAKFQLDRRKDRATLTENGSRIVRSRLPASTHKFVKPLIPSIIKNGVKVEADDDPKQHLHRPWTDRYGPANMEELAVHKKKVTDVQKWLVEVLNGRDLRVCAIPIIIASNLVLIRP